MMTKARGMTLTSLILVLAVVIIVAGFGFKLVMPYVQYYTIQKAFHEIASNPEMKSASRRDVIAAWQRYAEVDNMSPITDSDIDVENQSDGLHISASYSVRVHVVGNVSLLLDFNPSASSP
jgi:hypothetical protein